MITHGEAQTVLESEENPLRFEAFCNRVISLMIGRPVLGTTASGDLGVDGRAIQLDALAADVVVASSVRKDAVDKMLEDAKRIRPTQAAGEVYLATNKALSEQKKVTARKKVRDILGKDFRCTILSRDEIVEIALRFEGPLEELYGGDIQALRLRVAAVLSDHGATTQLQIAHALSSTEGFSNRERVAELLVVEVLARQASTINEVSVQLQALLRLPSTFPRSVAENAISALHTSNVVRKRDDDRYELTTAGQEQRQQRLQTAESEDQVRKKRLLDEVVSRLGYGVDAMQQERLWANLMHEMSNLLARLGARFVALIEAARSDSNLNEIRNLAGDSVRSACRNTVAKIADARVREETEEALYQSLLDVPTIALEWLEDIVAAWLAACQLGLVPEIVGQLRPALRRIALGLDTDIVLSILCEAEPDNGILIELLGKWAREAGRVFVAPEVLREVAHHAWIARIEFQEVASIMKSWRYDPGLARQVARNAFVRSFWAAARPVTLTEFDRYIGSYAGDRADDWTNIDVTLSRFALGQRIPVPSGATMSSFRHFEGGVRRVLARAARFAPGDPNGGAIEQDKMDRDAAAIVKYATVAHYLPASIGSLLLLSSSRRLALAVRQGAPSARVIVAGPSTLGLLMATAFENQFRPQAIAQLLLADGAHEQVHHLRSELMRMLARADLLSVLPQARIVSLEREVEFGIIEYAKSTSRSHQQVRREVLNVSDPEAAVAVISGALRRSAIGAETDRLIRAQADEIARLQNMPTPK